MNSFPNTSAICVPITESTFDTFFAELREAEQTADAIELRLDYLSADTLPRVIAELRSQTGQIAKPLIYTFRPLEQGGKRDLSLEDRRNFWRSLPRELIEAISFADFELDLVECFADSPPPIPWSKVICSWHNF